MSKEEKRGKKQRDKFIVHYIINVGISGIRKNDSRSCTVDLRLNKSPPPPLFSNLQTCPMTSTIINKLFMDD